VDTRRRIIEAAIHVFAQHGYAGTVMAQIAMQAGLGKGTLYEYFASKEELFFAVFEHFKAESETAATVSIAALGGSASQRLETLNDTLMALWGKLEKIYALVMEFWAASASSRLRERFKAAFRLSYEEFRDIVASLVNEGIASGEFRQDIDADAIAASLVGVWDALLLQAWFDDNFEPLPVSRKFLQVLLCGMQVQPNAKLSD
jgi:AcrR family transcriptional regulator